VESILNLLQSTENLLIRADENLKTLQSMKIEYNVGEKLQPLIEKYAEVDKAIDEQKVKLLGILIRLAPFVGAKIYHSSLGERFDYEICPPTNIRVCGGDLRGRSARIDLPGVYTIDEFISSHQFEVYEVCKWIVWVVANFLKGAPERQAEATRLISGLANELVELGKLQQGK